MARLIIITIPADIAVVVVVVARVQKCRHLIGIYGYMSSWDGPATKAATKNILAITVLSH